MVGIILLVSLGFIFSISIVFIEWLLNHKEAEFEKFLPGYNCGACGHGTCHNLAHEMLHTPEEYLKCKPMKGQNKEKLYKYLKEHNYIK